jgi:hypothetical protein
MKAPRTGTLASAYDSWHLRHSTAPEIDPRFFLGHVWFGLRHGTEPSEGGQDFSETFHTSEGWRSLLEGAGLVVERLKPWNRHGAYAFAYVCRKAGA